MSPALLAPAALLALAALAIPLLIHIRRRTETRLLDFAALRWLSPRTRPRSRPRLDELWLLAVRLSLLALLALWLARPVLWGVADDRAVVAVAPGADVAVARSLAAEARLVWLAPGYPEVTDGAAPESVGLASLIRQLDAELPPSAPLTLIVPEVLDDMDAERPRLSRRADWRVAGRAPEAQRTAPTPPALTIRHSAEAEGGVRYFRAVATAWATAEAPPRLDIAGVDEAVGDEATHLIWLSSGPLPDPVIDWIRDGGVALLAHDAVAPSEGGATTAWSDSVGAPLATATRLERGRVIRLSRPLEPAVTPQLLEPDFPEQIERLLAPPPAPVRVAAAAHAPLTGAAPYAQPPLDLRPWLALLIALLFIAERWMATSRRRAATP